MSRLRRTTLESRGGSGGVAASRKRGFPNTILMPSLKPWFMLNETSATIIDGLDIGDFWPTHQGGYRFAQAKEDLDLGKACFWAGPEEGRQSASNAKTLVPAKKGDRSIFIETTGTFDSDAFQEGKLRITGGTANVGRQIDVAYNDASYESTEISGAASRYVTKLVLADRLDFDIAIDNDWHCQGNMFACQRNAPGGSENTDIPKFHTGVPTVEVPEDHYFWCQVSGPATVQIRTAIGASDVTSGKIDLMPWEGTSGRTTDNLADVGKFEVIAAAADVPSQVFARLTVRSAPAADFAADAMVPAWLYGNAAV